MSRQKRNGYQVGATQKLPGVDASANILLSHVSHIGAKVSSPCELAAPRDPYHSEEKTFTTRPGGPDVATLMGEYINRYAIDTGSVLLMIHPIPANNSFLFIWENS